jgi:hypothetical protein
MVSPLPTGDALAFLSRWLLMSYKCIIWIALAIFAELPIVVGAFLLLDNINTAFPSTFFRSS